MSTITLDSVTKRFGDTLAVDDVSLTVADGEVLGVVGPSGCGKTTTLRTIAGFETPTAGTVSFDDRDVTHVPPEKRNVGLVFQEYALFDTMDVAGNVAFGLKMRGVDGAERRRRVDEVLEMLGIADLADRDPRTLSGGQAQRVGLARALAIEPDILLLDEPMTGLDAKLKGRLRRELGELLDSIDVTTLYVTHDQEEAMAMCDRLAVMHDGVLEQVGTPEAVYDDPATPFVADFVGDSTVLTGPVRDGALDLGYATVPVDAADGATATVVARPAAFEVGAGDVEGEVVEAAYVGDRLELTVRLPDGDLATVTAPRGAGYARGETLALSLVPEALSVVEVDGGTADERAAAAATD